MLKLKFINRKNIYLSLLLVFLIMAGVIIIDRYVTIKGNQYVITPENLSQAQAAIVLGAYVLPDGTPCQMLRDRIKTAVELYNNKKVQKIIMTGDHGTQDYDEVNYMRIYAEKLGVPTEDIFMDHAGFSTYDSMYRAKEIFLVNSAVVITQAFHLPRAVYTARALGIQATGVKADKHQYAYADYYDFREIPARIKAFSQLHLLHSKPRFLGESIPVTGDGRLTHDKFKS